MRTLCLSECHFCVITVLVFGRTVEPMMVMWRLFNCSMFSVFKGRIPENCNPCVGAMTNDEYSMQCVSF